jgi:hypothetical protein
VTESTISLREAAARLGISEVQSYRLARRGHLPGAFRPSPRRWRVSCIVFEKALADPSRFPTHISPFATEGNK